MKTGTHVSLRRVNGRKNCFKAEFREGIPEERGWELGLIKMGEFQESCLRGLRVEGHREDETLFSGSQTMWVVPVKIPQLLGPMILRGC